MKCKVGVFYPRNLAKVSTPTIVRGRVTKSGIPVQLYVQARDKKWYLQKPVIFNNKNFIGECSFGLEGTPTRTNYKVAAVISPDRPHSPVDSLDKIDYLIRVKLIK